MRKSSEKKEAKTSVRMTEEQKRIIQEMADQRGMSAGAYMVNSAVYSGKAITPEIMVHIQNLVNFACETVKEQAPKNKAYMESEVNKLWSLLK